MLEHDLILKRGSKFNLNKFYMIGCWPIIGLQGQEPTP
jgi:hypothetical protein